MQGNAVAPAAACVPCFMDCGCACSGLCLQIKKCFGLDIDISRNIYFLFKASFSLQKVLHAGFDKVCLNAESA